MSAMQNGAVIAVGTLVQNDMPRRWNSNKESYSQDFLDDILLSSQSASSSRDSLVCFSYVDSPPQPGRQSVCRQIRNYGDEDMKKRWTER